MSKTYILGIETSCDETSISIVKNGRKEIATVVLSQMEIHKLYGGVVPEIASRKHVESITLVLEECLKKAKMKIEDIDAIAVTYGPGLIGSLLIGLEMAKVISMVYDKPLIPVHHLAGHIYANNLIKKLKFPLLALVVSGGHTEFVHMKEHYQFKVLGETLDDAIGETYDKVARVIGLPYPGGPEIEKLAKTGEATYPLPFPLDDGSYNFSFSGLKSAVINLVRKEERAGREIVKENLAASFQKKIEEIFLKKTTQITKEYTVKNLVMAGGVAANRGIKNEIKKYSRKKRIRFSCPPIKYCTDNATMVAVAGYFAFKKGIRADLKLSATPNQKIQ